MIGDSLRKIQKRRQLMFKQTLLLKHGSIYLTNFREEEKRRYRYNTGNI